VVIRTAAATSRSLNRFMKILLRKRGSALAPLRRVPAKHQKEARGYEMMEEGDPDEV
jgi:hypothetical protein